MERTINVEVALNGLQVQEKPIFCQGDKNTHFLSVKFMEDVDLTGYTLQVYYLPPYPCVTPYVDLYSEITSNPFKVSIPNKILERNGQVKVEFSLSKESELITVNKTFNFEVIRTMNGTGVTAYPEGILKETIAQQIEKIKGLLADTDTKIEEYNNNATSKTEQYNNNSTEKFNSFNQNYDEKLKSFNQNHTQKTSAFNDNADSKLKTYNDNDVLKTQNYNNNAEEKKSAFNNNVTQVANKFTDYINNTLNTATTEMDRRATSSANAAGERANQEVKNQEGLSVQAVTNEGNKQVLAVGNKGTEEVSKVQSAGAKAVEDVNANKTANIHAVTEEGTKQTELVRTEGEKQIGLVVDKGTEQTTAIENKGTEETNKVTGEGSKQIKAVQNQGTVSLEAIINIQKQIEQILKNQEAIGNALALNGKTGVQYDKEIQSVAGMNFDPDLQYLNDAGTKKVGFCYLDRLTDGIFECIKQTTAVVNDSACFRNFSSKENSDRLGNLSIVWEEITRAKEPINYYKIEPDDVYWFDLIKPFKYSNKNGKRYDFFYVFTSHNMAWNYFDLFVTFDQMKKNSGRLRSFYADEYSKVKAITFLGIEDGVNKLYGGSESNPTSIVFYGGYIQSN